MTIGIVEWLQLRRLLREAGDAAVTPDLDFFEAQETPQSAEPVDRERVVEAGVTGFIVRFPDNPVLLGAISRIVGWRPNPAGSHHVPCTVQAVTGLLAFSEMYDFELTDGADAMVRQVIRESYRKGQWPRPAPRRSTEGVDEAAVPTLDRRRTLDAGTVGGAARWLKRHARSVIAAALLLYLVSPQVSWAREDDRVVLQPAPLGRSATVSDVLAAVERCQSTPLVAGATPAPGCDGTLQTRPGRSRFVLGTLNPVLRFFGWDSTDGVRGFVLCEQDKPFEACWER